MRNDTLGKNVLLTIILLAGNFWSFGLAEENNQFYIRGEEFIGSRLMSSLIEDYLNDWRGMNSTYIEPGNNSNLSIVGENKLRKETYIVEMINSRSAYEEMKDSATNMYIAMCATPINQKQRKLKNWKKNLIALDAIVFITNKRNHFSSISIKDLTDFLTGKKKYAQDSDDVVNIYIKEKNSVSYKILKELLKSEEIDTTRIYHLKSDEKIIDEVLADNNSIGVINLSSVNNSYKPFKLLKLKKRCGTRTLNYLYDSFSISDRRYPFIEEILLYGNSLSRHDKPSLIEYIKIKKAKETIKKKGFTVVHHIFEKSFDSQEERFSIVASEAKTLSKTLLSVQDKIKGARQLSSTIYFNKSESVYSQGKNRSIILNKIELTKLDLLAKFINKNKFKIKEVILIGFTDNSGIFNSNKSLSERRAKEVGDYLKNVKKFTKRITVKGLGELVNIDCGNDAVLNNRRVEVWIKYTN